MSLTTSNTTIASVDNGFGPFFQIAGQQTFDFTLFFEDTILSILPSALFVLAAPIRIIQLWQSSRKVAITKLRHIKIALLAIFVGLQIVNLIVWGLDHRLQTRASLAAASLSLVAACAVCVLSYMEHTRCVRPSSLISAYLLLTLVMDAAKVRTLWLRGESALVAGIASSALSIKFFVLTVEAQGKRKILLSPYSELPPETTSGLYSSSLFWWLNPMFLLGYRNILRDVDLFPTDGDLASETLRKKFQLRWSQRRSPARRYELIIAASRTMVQPLAVAVFPRLCQTFFRFMQPLLINRATKFVLQPESSFVTSEGWGLTAAYGLVYFGIAVSNARYNHMAYRMATMVRGALITTVYTKTMDLSLSALDENTAVTLMSTDVERICDILPRIHELWAAPIDAGLAIWLLYSEIGIAMFGPLFVCIACVTGAVVISSRASAAQREWLTRIQTRVDVTAKALQAMKGVKMLGLTATMNDIIHKLRATEVTQSLRTRKLRSYSILCGNGTDVFAPGAAFAVFVIIAHYNGQLLKVSSAYTALSLISLLANPINQLAFTIPSLVAVVGCFDRIQEYLLSTSRHDHRFLVSLSLTPARAKGRALETLASSSDMEGIEMMDMVSPQRSSVAVGMHNPVLQAQNLTVFWDDKGKPVLNDITFELSPGVTMLVGPVGSGKSSLLKALLGEIPSSKGYVYTNTLQIAFVDQTPWIQHGSIRENIVGTSTYNRDFYSRVIHACVLDQDLERWPQGDFTPVGSAGVSLSGGQKLRVALARAIYSKHHIIFLDDVFSGLDPTTEDRIFSRLLGKKGLLRDSNTTVMLATHAAHRLSYADRIIVLGSDGAISEQGTFTELMNAKGYVSSLAARHTAETDDKPKEVAELATSAGISSVVRANAAEDINRSTGDFAVYKYYFAATGYRNTVLVIAIVSCFAIFQLFPDLLVNFWTSAIAAKGNSVNGKYLTIYLVLGLGAWIALVWASFHVYTIMIPNSAINLHAKLLGTVRNAPLSFFTSTDIGQVINRFSQDMNVVDAELPGAMFQLLASSTIALVQAVLICLSAAYFALIMPLVFGLMYLIQKFYLRTSRQIRLMDLEAKAPLYSNFIESLNGLATIRAFGWEANFEQRNLDLLDHSQRPFYLLFCIQRWLNLVLDLTVTGLAVALMVLIVTLRSKLNAGLVGLSLLQIMNFNFSLTSIIREYTSIETSLGAISRVKNFVQTTASEHLPRETDSAPDTWPSKGGIVFENVSASYAADGPLVLKQVDLDIPAGQKFALVGRSGSGKSSFITALFHMLEIADGAIKIDNIDLATVPREQLRQRLNVIPQEPLFIAGTIRQNLDPFSLTTATTRLQDREGTEATDPLLPILELVNLLPSIRAAGGLDAPLDPENQLSHGQRQLFCLARALVTHRFSSNDNNKILILDEATASVDLGTDELMQRIIRSEFVGCTVVAVAHRLGTVVDFDRVVVLDGGCVVEDGVPSELLAREGGSRFRTLWDS